jgi:hypothetical protein
MTNAINSSNTYVPQATPQPAATARAASSKTPPAVDTVHLSGAAKAALGDVDHDGDSR